MHARAKILGHPIHPMLIVFPLGLLGGSIVFDIAYLVSKNGKWAEIAFWMIPVGVISGLIAAVFGVVDLLSIPPGTRARSVGIWHGVGNVAVVVLFIISWFVRKPAPPSPHIGAIILSFVGVALACVTGWLGGELVDRLGVGVDDGAHLNSPSSLSGRPAADDAHVKTS